MNNKFLTLMIIIGLSLTGAFTAQAKKVIDAEVIESMETWIPITGESQTFGSWTLENDDDEYEWVLPADFDFEYDDQKITKLFASNNGYISLNEVKGSYSSNIGSASINGVIGWCVGDMKTVDVIRILVEGDAPNRVITIQWDNNRHYNEAGGENIFAQIKLFETIDKVQIVYGPTGNWNGTRPAWAGFTGFINTEWINIQPGSPSKFHRSTEEEPKTDDFLVEANIGHVSEGLTYTYNRSVPHLTDIYPSNLTSFKMGRMFPSDVAPSDPTEHPAFFITRLASHPTVNLKMTIYQKGHEDDPIYTGVKNSVDIVSVDENTPVRINITNAMGIAAGDNAGFPGYFDLKTNLNDIRSGDYKCQVEMTCNDDPTVYNKIVHSILLPLENDLALYKVESPKSSQQKIYPVTGAKVIVKIRNKGLVQRTEWKLVTDIRDQHDNIVKSYEFKYPEDDSNYPDVESLKSNEFYTVDFGYYVGDAVGNYAIHAKVSFDDAEDELPENNVIPHIGDAGSSNIFTLAEEIDLRTIGMVTPADQSEVIIGRPFKPVVSVSNLGANASSKNTVKLTIKDSDGNKVYESDYNDAILSSIDTMSIKYSKDFIPKTTGTFEACFIISSDDDNTTEHKTVCNSFTVIGALENTYTVGTKFEPAEGDAPNPRNFATIQDAVDALYKYGVTAPVVFELTDKVYEVGDIENIHSPALDLSSKITGMSKTNTVTFKASAEKAVEHGAENTGVTIKLRAGNGQGIRFGQNPFPSNVNAVAFYSKDPNERMEDNLLPEFVNSEGHFIFDGGRNNSLRFLIYTPTTKASDIAYNVAMYLAEGSKNITVKNCVFENPMSETMVPHSLLPHTRRSASTREYQPDKDIVNGTAFSAAIALRTKTPIFEDGQNRLFFDTLGCENNTFENNVISGFGYGISSMGSGPLLQETSGKYARFNNAHNTYKGNEIFNVSQAGIFLGYEDYSTVTNNRIYNVTGNSPDIDVMPIAAGIMVGNKILPKNKWNNYNNIGIKISNNEISNVRFEGDSPEASVAGIYVIQSQNQMMNPSSGFVYFPDEDESFVITNNIIWGLQAEFVHHNRTGIQISTEAIEKNYKSRNDVILNNTVIIEDDGKLTKGNIAGISLEGTYNTKVLNNAISVADNAISPDSKINACIYYEGILPGLDGGLISNRNAFNKIFKNDASDNSGVAIYAFREFDSNIQEWLKFDKNGFETLRQWRNHTAQDQNSVIGDFTKELEFIGTKDNKTLRVVTPAPKGSILNNRADLVNNILTTDIDGNVRGQAGSMFDIGACEFEGELYLQDMEIKTISEPSIYKAGSGMFSDAEYIMTTLPIDVKVIIRNSGSLDQSGVKVSLKVYRENADAVFTDKPLGTIDVYTDVVTTSSVEVSFDLAAFEADKPDSLKMFKTYSDLRDSDPQYNIPEHFRGAMESNVTPRYKFVVELRPDENNANNVSETVARYYLKKSGKLNMLVSGEYIETPIEKPAAAVRPSDDAFAGRLNFENLNRGLKGLSWLTAIDKDIIHDDEDLRDSLKVDVLDRNSWEPRSIDYSIYKFLVWSDADENALTREEKWDLETYVSSGVSGNKKNLVIASQEMVRANAFKMVFGDKVEDQSFINSVLRAEYTANETPWAAGTSDKKVLGQTIDRDALRTIKKLTALDNDWNGNDICDEDPAARGALMNVYGNGDGLARPAYSYVADADITGNESTMGVVTVASNRNIIYLGTEWRHFKDVENVLRAVIDCYINNDGTSVAVELTAFDAKAVSNKVNINWATASEINSDRFEIEKAAVNNGIQSSFETIETVSAAGKSASTLNYGPYIDANVKMGAEYIYRLAMIDADGTVEYSNERLVNISEDSNLFLGQATPSPASDYVSFDINTNSEIKVIIIDANGKTTIPDFELAASTIKVDVSGLASGSYTIVVKSDNKVSNKQFNVVK